MMVGRELTDFYKHEVSTTLTPNRFVVNQITDGKRVKPTSFSVAGGEILALSGLVGSGRTEMARLILGPIKVPAARVLIDGKRVHIKSPLDAIRHGIGYVPEDRKSLGIFLEMTGQENITMNVIDKTSSGGILSRKKMRISPRGLLNAFRSVSRARDPRPSVFPAGTSKNCCWLGGWK